MNAQRKRFLLGFVVDPDTDCWVWQRNFDRHGYGQIWSLEAGTQLAHRVAFIFLRGPIPDGLVIDHLCRVRACVNPDHLEPGRVCIRDRVSAYKKRLNAERHRDMSAAAVQRVRQLADAIESSDA